MKKDLLSVHAKSFNWAGFFLSKKVYKMFYSCMTFVEH